jgi:hypothetical protein
VSYLAQTRTSTPVILSSPECVDGAADADSQLLFQVAAGPIHHQASPSGHIQPIGILHPRVRPEPAADTIRPYKFSNLETKGNISSG